MSPSPGPGRRWSGIGAVAVAACAVCCAGPVLALLGSLGVLSAVGVVAAAAGGWWVLRRRRRAAACATGTGQVVELGMPAPPPPRSTSPSGPSGDRRS